MNDLTVFNLISKLSKEKGVSCILIGGFAVNYYKVSRQTADVDFLITEKDFKKIIEALTKAGYRQDFGQEGVFAHFRSSEKTAPLDVDFMLVNDKTFSGMIEQGKRVQIGGQEFIIPSINHLIALKLHSLKFNFKLRENKDLPDIINLINLNQLDYQSQEFKELCLKYGTEDLYKKILKRMA